MRPAEDIKKQIEQMSETTSAEMDKQVLEDALQVLADSHETQSADTGPSKWRIIMRNRIAQLAAAAVVLFAVVGGIIFLSESGSGIALADVLSRVEQAGAFTYKIKMTMEGVIMPGSPVGKQEMQGAIIISKRFGMKIDIDTTDLNSGQKMTQQMYVLPDRKAIFMIMPSQKQYVRMEFSDDVLGKIKKQNNDPRDLIRQMMSCKCTELGSREIDGVKVEGFRTTDPAFTAMESGEVTLWVDSKTWLPVRTEMDVRPSEQLQMQATMYDYQWDIPVSAGEFEPVIPDDFTTVTGGSMKLPDITEEAAVEGLQLFVDLAGRFPDSLGMMNLMQEIMSWKDSNTPAAQQLRQAMQQARSEGQQAAKVMEVMRPIQSLGMFYMALMQDSKEPVYHGEWVTASDVDAVLLRWKISQDRYRVIFGDLSTADVNAVELAEMEGSQRQ